MRNGTGAARSTLAAMRTRSKGLLAGSLAAALVTGGVLLAGCSTAAPSSANVDSAAAAATPPVSSEAPTRVAAAPENESWPQIPVASFAGDERRLKVTDEGVFIRNGGAVQFEDGLTVELFLDPWPPRTLRAWLDVYVTRHGEPIPDISMGIEYDMLAMLHGPFWGEAENLGNGHYVFTLDYIMYGAWDQLVTIRVDGRRLKLPVIIAAYP